MKKNDSEHAVIINGSTKLYGIVGNPLEHSFSPAMQTMAFQEQGINAVYLPFLSTPETFKKTIESLEHLGVQGFNVTVPFKQLILPYLHEISPTAKILQSVNTVIRTSTGWK